MECQQKALPADQRRAWRQWFPLERSDRSTGEMATIQCGNECGLIHKATACDVDVEGARPNPADVLWS